MAKLSNLNFKNRVEHQDGRQPVALITGGLNGIGRATAEWLIDHGWRVIVADIDKNGLQSFPDSILKLHMDVTDSNSLSICLRELEKLTNDLDAIIQCAGVLVVGSLIDVSVEEMMKILDVNLLGIYRVNQFFLPFLLKRAGRIIIMSSEVGVQTPIPFNGPYAISKYALEAYTDTLRRELSFLGIKVVKIRAGAVRTNMTDSVIDLFKEAITASSHFKAIIEKNIDLLETESKKGVDPEIIAKVVHRALTTKNPKPIYVVNQDFRRSILSIFPTQIADRLIHWFLRV